MSAFSGAASGRLPFLLAGLLMLAGCSTGAILGGLTPGGGSTRVDDIAYGPDPRQRLDVYRPAPETTRDAAPGTGAPVVVFFYGGSWNNGSRETFGFIGKALAARGFVAVLADYRLYPQVRYPEFLRDGAAAVGWTVREVTAHGGDPKRLFLMGHSAGAYNAAMLSLDPRWLNAIGLSPSRLSGWIGLAGPYDFLPIRNPDVKPVFHHPDYPRDSQPIDYANRSAPPTFLGAASVDSLVDPQRNSAQLAARLEQAGVPTALRFYPRANHITLIGAFAGPFGWFGPVLDDVTDFIRSRSASGPRLPPLATPPGKTVTKG